jgi:hypothetical protein
LLITCTVDSTENEGVIAVFNKKVFIRAYPHDSLIRGIAQGHMIQSIKKENQFLLSSMGRNMPKT